MAELQDPLNVKNLKSFENGSAPSLKSETANVFSKDFDTLINLRNCSGRYALLFERVNVTATLIVQPFFSSLRSLILNLFSTVSISESQTQMMY